MRRILFVIILCMCGLAFANATQPHEKYTTLILPDNVTLGMTRDALQSGRPEAKKLDMAVGSRNTNSVVLTEMKEESSLAVFYHFIEDRLRAVTKGQLHVGKRDEETVKHIHDALRRDLVKKSDENIVRLDESMKQIQVSAELWQDEKSGACVYFVDTSNEMTVITFDPKYFGKKDFFMSPDEMPKIAPALENVRKTIEESKKLKK